MSEPEQQAAGRPAAVIGVLGAGTMGSGIAQLACRSGAQTLLYDPLVEALEAGRERALDGLRREAAKGRLDAEQARAAGERLSTVAELDALSDCELVIEAVPERLELKHQIYGRLSEIVTESCVLASNTSSLPITAIAAGATHPERVVGMHFFNPAPVMALLEVIAGCAPVPRHSSWRARRVRRWARPSSTRPTAPGSWSTAATARSAWRR